MSEEGGIWRTIGGRRVFIKDGEDIATAMKNSGKFENKNFKAILKSELESIGIPVAVVKTGTKKAHTRNLGYKTEKQKGVEIERRVYTTRRTSSDKTEEITIYTNGFISKTQINEITSKIKADYKPYLYDPYIKDTKIFVF